MNEIFEFRKELNIKKIILVIVLILLVLAILVFGISQILQKKKEIEIETSSPNQKFYASNNILSLELPKSYSFIQYQPSNNYILELRTETNLNIFVSKETALESKPLSEIVSADIKAYIEEFDTYSNLSEIKEFDINGSLTYTYSLHYLDSKAKTSYYLQVIWIEHNSNYYILDIEFPLDSLTTNSNIINDTLNSLTLY